MLEPMRPEAVLPDRALCLPTFSHSLIVNKASLSLSLSLSVYRDLFWPEYESDEDSQVQRDLFQKEEEEKEKEEKEEEE
jgi:hypothetical protein